jgi:hypothetical protein
MKPKKPAARTETKIRSEFLNMKPERRAEMVDSLMNSYKSKSEAASTQKQMGDSQVKNKVKSGQTGTSKYKESLGTPYPVGKERLKIAEKLKMGATKDSLQASILEKLNKLKK